MDTVVGIITGSNLIWVGGATAAFPDHARLLSFLWSHMLNREGDEGRNKGGCERLLVAAVVEGLVKQFLRRRRQSDAAQKCKWYKPKSNQKKT